MVTNFFATYKIFGIVYIFILSCFYCLCGDSISKEIGAVHKVRHLAFWGIFNDEKETARKIPRSKRGPWGSPPQWTGIEGEHEGEDWHNWHQNPRTYTQSTKTSVLSRQWLWRLLPRIRNPIWINATNTQESNSWPVAEVNYVPLIIKVQTPRQTNPRFAVLWLGPANCILQYKLVV